jgi:polyisoprenyl-teichoic acid--peptidoglycan teichoic acid transferase
MALRRVTAGLLSFALPGAGQLYVGKRARAAVLLGLTALVTVGAATLVTLQPFDVLDAAVRRETLVAFLAANLLLLALRLFAVVDAWRGGSKAPATLAAAVGLAVLVSLTLLPHAAAAWYAVRGYETLADVFADEEPQDVLPADGLFLDEPSPQALLVARDQPGRDASRPVSSPSTTFHGRTLRLGQTAPGTVVSGRGRVQHPWVTILLVGSDHGPERAGHRTDTMIVVALERDGGRAVALGVPRNIVEVPLVGPAAKTVRRFRLPLNALYQFGLEHPDLFPGGEDAGATALKQTISSLLGIRVDYYAFVDLDGFVRMVDALGGVRIHVKERLVDEVTRPAWGETKPTIDVEPGRTYLFTGRTALAYVRSRKASSDYRRMARQRCFLSSLAAQIDAKAVLRHFGALTAIARDSVRTDVPLRSVPDLVRLAAAVDPRLTVTETFGTDYIRARRADDGYPLPAIGLMRAAARDAIVLDPGELERRRGIATAARSC